MSTVTHAIIDVHDLVKHFDEIRAKTPAAGAGQTRVCFTASGVPLLIQSTAQGVEATLEATAFSTTVADADFQLPAQPGRTGPP